VIAPTSRFVLFLTVLTVMSVLPVHAEGLGGQFLPIPVAFSYPETGIGGGTKLRWQDPFDRPGYLDLTAFTTVRGQSEVDLGAERDSIAGVWRLTAAAEVGKFPEHWFGPGDPPADSLNGLYTPTNVGGYAQVSRWLADGWSVGGQVYAERTSIRTDHRGIFLDTTLTGMQGGLDLRSAAILEREGRDLKENPRRGSYLGLKLQTALWGSDFDWSDLLADASDAVSFGDFTLVGRLRHEEAVGTIPFWNLPFLGYRKTLRGLPDKRLRGRSVQCVGTELRWNGPLVRAWGLVVPTQLAVFGELGRAGGHAEVWTAMPRWAAGGGGRFPLAGGKAVLRVDYGWSQYGSGLYLDFGQAF
jgi:hypothetical protein